MHPRVTLQLPAAPHVRPPARDLRGARCVLIGHGYVARALSPALSDAGVTIETISRADSPARLRAAFSTADFIVCSAPPAKDRRDAVLDLLQKTPTRAAWVGYLSATSVYGDRQGGWAFEGEAPTPSLPRGIARAQAEINWLVAYPTTHIFRLAGIYGPGRAPFARIRSGKARIIDAPGHVVNRIHIEDIVSALIASMRRPSPQNIYNVADGQPAAPGEVLAYAAELIDKATPPTVALDHPSVSTMARSFYAETKRVDISHIKTRLDWEPRYNNYRVGLDATLAAERKNRL
jgi:nucleoside-diphosphate-sugar epimerase